MTETEKDEATSTNEIADADFSDADKAPELGAPAAPARRGFTGSIAWLALFLALVSFAAAGYTLFNNWRAAPEVDDTAEQIDALNSRIDTLNDLIASQRSEIAALGSADTGINTSISALRRDLDERASLFDSLPPRMSSLERSVASLQGVSIETRNTYLIAEAEYYLQIGNAQLQLAGNPYLASLALEQADDRLLQLGDPALTDVRRAISDELAALEVMERPDLAGATLTLGSLSLVVDSLPLRPTAGAETSDPDTQAAGEDGEEPSGMRRAWNSVTGAFSGAITITPPTEDMPAFLMLEAEPLIRSNLSLQLQAARLALLRGEQEIFETSLDDADTWIQTYFDTENDQVRSVRQTLADIRVDYSAAAPPDISTSLRLLRQYKLLSESAASSTSLFETRDTPAPRPERPVANTAVDEPPAAEPETTEAAVAEAETPEPAASEETAEAETSEAAVAEVTEPALPDPEPSEPEAAAADAETTETSEAAAAVAEEAEAPTAESALPEPESSEPESDEAAVAEADSSEPDLAETAVAEAEATDPDVAEPDE